MDTIAVPVECPSGPLHTPIEVPAAEVAPGDRFWWPELGAWRHVIDVSHPDRHGRVHIDLRSDAERPTRLDVARHADAVVIVESPRQQRETPVRCRHCSIPTIAATGVCPSTTCATAERAVHRSEAAA